MSHIDSYDHEYIGRLGYLPIYHPLQKIKADKWGGADFSASPENLVLGGGSGEHPGLVIHKLECVVARFLYDQLSDDDENSISADDLDTVFNLAYESNSKILEFCDWPIKQYASLTQMAKSVTLSMPLAEDEEVEDWLCKSIGELVFFALPELNPQQGKFLSIFESVDIQATMQNVLCPPPGYPVRAGRKTENGNVQWGLQRWHGHQLK